MDKTLFLFTTQLANQASDAVKSGRFQTIITFHKSLEETKRCLSKAAPGKSSPAKMHLSASSYPLPDALAYKSGECPAGSPRLPPQDGPSGGPLGARGPKLPPPNIKLESPVNGSCCPAPSSQSFKRDFSHNMMMNNDGGILNSMPTILPYGLDASNMPITDTHYGNFTSNGDPLEKMARLTQEALPFEPPLKHPKLEPNSDENIIKSTATNKSLDNGSNSCNNSNDQPTLSGNTSSSSTPNSNKTPTDKPLTEYQRQQRQEKLQKIEGYRNTFDSFTSKPQMQQMVMQHFPLSFMPGMQCPPNMTAEMMLNMNVNMNANVSQGQLGPGSTMHPTSMMLPNNAYLMHGEQQKLDQPDICIVPPINEKIQKNSAARAATPKNSGKNSANARGSQPTMMVQGKPAVMVHPNMNAKTARSSISRSSSSAAVGAEKFFPGAGPPNITFLDATYGNGPGAAAPNGPPFCGDPYPTMGGLPGGQFGPRAFAGSRGFADPGGPRFTDMNPRFAEAGPRFAELNPRFAEPGPRFASPQQQQQSAATVVFNNGPRGGPQQQAHGPNLNVNMNIQINAPAPPPPPQAQQQQQQQMGGPDDGMAAPQACYQQQQAEFCMGQQNLEEEDVFYDQMYGSGLGGAIPSNVNIAVTGMYPPSAANPYGGSYYPSPQQQLTANGGPLVDPFGPQGPNPVPQGHGFGGPQCQGPSSDPTSGGPRHLAGPGMHSPDMGGGGYRSMGKMQAINRQQQSGGGTFVNATMSIQHNVNMAGGMPYGQTCPQPNQPGGGYMMACPQGGPYPGQQQQQRPMVYRNQQGGPLRPSSAQAPTFFGQFSDFNELTPKMTQQQQQPRNQQNFAQTKDQLDQQQQHQMPQGNYDVQHFKNFQQQLYSTNSGARRGSDTSNFMGGPPT